MLYPYQTKPNLYYASLNFFLFLSNWVNWNFRFQNQATSLHRWEKEQRNSLKSIYLLIQIFFSKLQNYHTINGITNRDIDYQINNVCLGNFICFSSTNIKLYQTVTDWIHNNIIINMDERGQRERERESVGKQCC